MTVPLRARAFEIWDEAANGWTAVPGAYEIQAGRSLTDGRLTARVHR